MSSPFTAASDPSWSDGLLSLLLSTDTFEGFLHELTVLTVGTSALIDFSKGVRFPTDAQQAAFVTASTKMPASLPYVQRYAWFGLPAVGDSADFGLYRTRTRPHPRGRRTGRRADAGRPAIGSGEFIGEAAWCGSGTRRPRSSSARPSCCGTR
jgi:hypothetical protein